MRTDAYGRALEILDLTHVVVISGEAGMGEDYYSLYIGHGLLDIEDFEGFIWADTLEEAEARWDITAKSRSSYSMISGEAFSTETAGEKKLRSWRILLLGSEKMKISG